MRQNLELKALLDEFCFIVNVKVILVRKQTKITVEDGSRPTIVTNDNRTVLNKDPVE